MKGRKLTLEELVEALKDMIKAEKKVDSIPTKPPADFTAMKRRNVNTFGTPSSQIRALDEKQTLRFAKVKTQAADRIAERHLKRRGTVYNQMQPIKTPTWDMLVGGRINVLFDMDYTYAEGENKDGTEIKKEMRWCQGKVLTIISQNIKEAEFNVEWDAMLGLGKTSTYTKASVSTVTLEAAKFNKDKEDGWRLDLDFVVIDIDFVDKESEMNDDKVEEKGEGESDDDSDVETCVDG